MAVPCQLIEDPKPQLVQTYVIKAAEDVASAVLRTWATSQGVLGAGAWSVVEVGDAARRKLYLVVTFHDARRFTYRVIFIKESLLQLPTHPTVEWVRPLTRRLQRYFGWGDLRHAARVLCRLARRCAAAGGGGLRARVLSRTIPFSSSHGALRCAQLSLSCAPLHAMQEVQARLL